MNRVAVLQQLRNEREWTLVDEFRIGFAHARIRHDGVSTYSVIVELKGVQSSYEYHSDPEGGLPPEEQKKMDLAMGRFHAGLIFDELIATPSG